MHRQEDLENIKLMKRYIVVLAMLCLLTAEGWAQTSMTDEEVLQFVVEQYQKGMSQSQIVTKLMEKGVSIDQMRRVKAKYEKQSSSDGLGVKDITGQTSQDRSRTANSQKRKMTADEARQMRQTSGQMQRSNLALGGSTSFDESNPDYWAINDEIGSLLPDSLLYYMEEQGKRKVFGRDIFNNEMLSFEPNMNIATPQNYRLGAGDAVFIDIYGASQKSIEATISPDGTVVIEGYGPVSIGGLTVAEANQRLAATVGERYSSSKIQLTVGQTRTIMVNVMGEVKAPGTYTLSAFATVFHALYMAGGISDIGTLRDIKVYRQNKLVGEVDVYDYILNGKLTGNVRLTDNDVIMVGPYDCIVDIQGKVKRPMLYEMKKTESVGTAISYAGGFTGDAYRKSVRLIRKAGTQYSVYNVGEFDMNSFRLDDGDSISVDSVIARFSNMVEVRGAVFRPGMYQLGGDVTSVRSLIEMADGLTEDAFTARGVMHRMKADRTLEALSVDVKGIMEGVTPDIPLRNEDILFIPSKRELQEERTLTIHGEVRYSGIYVYADNETIEDLIMQAGGPTEAASMMKVDVSRRITNTNTSASPDTIARTYSFKIKDGFVVDGENGFTLLPFDEVYVRKSPGYVEQQNVTVEGEVLFGGTYTLERKTQRLSEVIAQAGGLTAHAYAHGARLERTITPDERVRMESVLRMTKAQSGQTDTLDINKLDFGNTYYVGIDLEKALADPGGDYDIVLREGDKISVPQYSGTVKISGDVMYPTTVAYRSGKDLEYYIDQAGGWGNRAKKKRTYIINMNGTVAKAKNVKTLEPGCEVVVPSKAAAARLTTAEIVAIASGTASIATMIAAIANLID